MMVYVDFDVDCGAAEPMVFVVLVSDFRRGMLYGFSVCIWLVLLDLDILMLCLG